MGVYSQPFFIVARRVIDVRSEDISQHLFPSLVTLQGKLFRSAPAVNLK
jgi:hypothetical protein